MRDKIEALVYEYSDSCYTHLYKYNEDDELESSLIRDLEKLFEENGIGIFEYSIQRSVVFSCPSGDYGYLSIALVYDDCLIHLCYETA
jgi:hypothetical protein